MFWTLILVVCMGLGVGAAYLYKFKVTDPKKNYIPPPSDALIDQALPTEIMHLIMLESDLQTLLNISEVSKYWNYLSNLDFIRDRVYKKEGNYRPTKEEFEADQRRENNTNFIPYESMQWLQYDRETHPPHWIVEDLHLSKKRDKKIIDAPLPVLYDFERSLGYIPNGVTREVHTRMTKYLVKLRLNSVAITVLDNWKFREGDNKDLTIIIPKQQIQPEWKFIQHVPVEIISDMIALLPGVVYLRNIERYRVIDNRKLIAGRLPRDDYLVNLLFLLLIPCLMMDLWTMPSGFQYVIYYIIAVVSVITVFIFAAVALWQGKQWELVKGFIFFTSIILTILAFGLIFTPWMITLRIGFFIATLHITTQYFVNTHKYIIRSYHKYALAILGYIGIMILFVLDWKLMADSLKDGTTWPTLLYNCLIYCGFIAFLFYLNFGRNSTNQYMQRTWTFKGAMKIDKPLKIYLIVSALVSVLLALWAPNLYKVL